MMPGPCRTLANVYLLNPMRLARSLIAALAALVLSHLFAPSATAQANAPAIKSTRLTGSSLSVQGENLPVGPLVVRFNGVLLAASYDRTAQQIAATVPVAPPAGTYLLTISKSNTLLASADVTVGAVGPRGPAGPAGPTGPAGVPGPQGPQGLTGPAGPTGPQGPQGRRGVPGLSIVWRGEWSPTTLYAVNDAVSLNGSSYIAKVSVAGASPDLSPVLWDVLASAGIAGPAGPTGPAGIPGLPGAPGVAGPEGVQGPQGVPGPVGLQGPVGPAGVPGPKGDPGETGPAGPAGPAGNALPGTMVVSASPSVPGYSSTRQVLRFFDTWATKAPMPTPRYYCAVVEFGGRIFAIGGYGPTPGVVSAAIEEFDPLNNVWTSKAPLVTPVAGASAAFDPDRNRIWITGGQTADGNYSSVVQYFDVENSTCHLASGTLPGNRAYHTSVYVSDGRRLFLMGGTQSGFDIFNTGGLYGYRVSGTRVDRQFPGAAFSDNKVYLIGGYSTSGYESSVEMCDVDAGFSSNQFTWTAKAPMISGRSGTQCVVDQGRILTVGGYGPDGAGGIDEYNIESDAWTRTAGLTLPDRWLTGLAFLNQKFYFMGSYGAGGRVDEYVPGPAAYILFKN
ncbi:MAG: hypothetical protein JNL10_00050 [Verrucomicrobiales bacterium]|nr:hypothetical protein [Verrucomicrobiales bacterium]